MSTLQEKHYLAKQQLKFVNQFFSTKSHEYSPPWRITSPFLPLLIVFARFKLLTQNKQTNKRKKANKMFCESFVLMKLKSHFSWLFRRTFFAKTFREKYSRISLFAVTVISYCCKYLRLFPVKIVTNKLKC